MDCLDIFNLFKPILLIKIHADVQLLNKTHLVWFRFFDDSMDQVSEN